MSLTDYSERSVIHHRTGSVVGSSEAFSEQQEGNISMVVAHHPRVHRKETPGLWILLSLVMIMGTATLLSSFQMQDSWLSLSRSIADAMPESVQEYNSNRQIDTSLEAQERWRSERNRKWRYYPLEPRKTPIPSDICGSAPEFNKFFEEQKFNRRSANDEDKTLHRLFAAALKETGTSGTYVEVGAYNGRVESNTRFFHECLGWQGLLIDANPKIYNALVRNRPHDHRLSYSPTCSLLEEMSHKTVPFHSIDATTAGIEGNALLHMGEAFIKVPCGSLTSVLVELFPEGHVDLFSLDLEGAEADVVEKMNFDQLFIELIMVENFSKICGKECEVRDRVRKRLKDVGYALYSNIIVNSDLFIHPDSKYVLPKDYPTIPVEDYIAQV